MHAKSGSGAGGGGGSARGKRAFGKRAWQTRGGKRAVGGCAANAVGGGSWLFRAARHASVQDQGGRPLGHRARLVGELLSQRAQGGDEIRAATPFIAVGQDGASYHHVRVGELGGARGRVLAHEGHRKVAPIARHAWILEQGQLNVLRLKEAVVHAAGPAEHVRQVGVEPIVRKVERLHLLVGGALECARGGPLAPHEVGHHLGVVDRAHPLQAHESEQPRRQQRLHVPVIPRAIEQEEVGRGLEHLFLEADLDNSAELREQRGHTRVVLRLDVLHRQRAAASVEEGIE